MSKPLKSTAAVCLLAGAAAHADGYRLDSSGNVVRTGYDECWHTGYWQPGDARVGCDGKVVAAETVEVVEAVGFAAVEPAEPLVHRITLDSETYFNFDKATLKPEAVDRLELVLSSVRGYDDIGGVAIIGHADRIGDADYKRRLAMQRAETVRRHMTEHGTIPAPVMQVSSEGESDPLVNCAADLRGQALIDCLAPNRRVEVDIQATERQ